MAKLKDLTGQTFCKWTVLGQSASRYITPDKRKYILWRCRCECGAEADVLGSHLVGRKSGRCRACKYEQMKLLGRMPATLWHRMISNARARGILVSPDLTRDNLRELFDRQRGRCALTGLPIHFATDSRQRRTGDITASLDRIDSTKGYEIGNVQWLHRDVNKMKMDLTTERLIELCALIGKCNTKVACDLSYHTSDGQMNLPDNPARTRS